MTVRIPPENILDKTLKLLNKERKIILPDDAGKVYQNFGPYVQINGKRESFFKALIRQNKKPKSEKEG